MAGDPKDKLRDFSNLPASVHAYLGADGTGADVPPAAVAEPLELDAPASEPIAVALVAERLRVLSNYAYYDDDGLFRAWPQGAIVIDPDEIELLNGRKAPVERADL